MSKGAGSHGTYRESEWTSYHIFYHDQGNRLLLQMVLPAVHELWLRRQALSFFFMRYKLGGSHIRLRLFCPQGSRDEVDAIIKARASDFFRRWPSVSSLKADEIREQNRRIVAADPAGNPGEID